MTYQRLLLTSALVLSAAISWAAPLQFQLVVEGGPVIVVSTNPCAPLFKEDGKNITELGKGIHIISVGSEFRTGFSDNSEDGIVKQAYYESFRFSSVTIKVTQNGEARLHTLWAKDLAAEQKPVIEVNSVDEK